MIAAVETEKDKKKKNPVSNLRRHRSVSGNL